jgi:protein kinase/serine/threonine-protein kinase
VLRVQAEVARKVADALEATLSEEGADRIQDVPTRSVTAYDFYLRGREATRTYTMEGFGEGLRLFQRAIELDSAYANAWAGLADAYSLGRQRFGLGFNWTDSAVAASRRAIELDEKLADGHKALGHALSTKGLYRQAITSYLQAIDLSPSHGPALNNTGTAYSVLEAFDEALRWIWRAYEVRPNGPFARSNMAESYALLGERELADQWLDDALALDPGDAAALRSKAVAHVRFGEVGEAIAVLDSLCVSRPNDPGVLLQSGLAHLYARDYETSLRRVNEAVEAAPYGFLRYYKWGWTMAGFAHLQMGNFQVADSLFEQSLSVNQIDLDGGLDIPLTPWENASIFAALGRVDTALAWAEKAFEMGGRRYWDAEQDPMFESVRDHPRFMALVRQMREDVEAMRRRVEEEEIAAGIR